MRPDIAKAALQFLNRVQLRGDEVQAFTIVQAEIHKFTKEPKAVEEDKPEAEKEDEDEQRA